MVKKKIFTTISLIICITLSTVLSACNKETKTDPFQTYLDSLKQATGAIAGVDYQASLRAEGYNLDYEKVEFSETGPVQYDSTPEEIRRIKEENQTILQGLIGEFAANEGGTEFYRIKDHEDLRYLIRKKPNGLMSVWEFKRFHVFYIDAPYIYGDALSFIYNVNSAKDIKQIVFLPPTFDNTETGKAVQKEIGTVTVKKASDIEVIYDVLKEMLCYGEFSLGRDDLPCYRTDTIRAMKAVQSYTGTKLYREIRIDLKNGTSITSLKYSGIWGGFYEDYGVAYHDLTDEQAALIERLGKIQKD